MGVAIFAVFIFGSENPVPDRGEVQEESGYGEENESIQEEAENASKGINEEDSEGVNNTYISPEDLEFMEKSEEQELEGEAKR